MITKYLTIKYVKPIPVQFKDGVNMFNILEQYIDTYQDCFIGIHSSYKEAIEAQKDWYIMFGDCDICKDLNTINHLENCYKLELDTTI